MSTRLAICIAFLAFGAPASAHRLDEYLQATIVSIEQGQIRASMRLIPGVAVSAALVSATDSNGDGVFSADEQKAYAEAVLHDLSVSVDGHKLTPRLQSVSFPALDDVKEGVGEIHIEFAANVPGGSSRRKLILENHHRRAMSVYLMNCLAPRDPGIRVMAQSRDRTQAYYRVDYSQGVQENPWLSRWKSSLAAGLSSLTGVPRFFRLGIRHIAEGTDHLLFLIALLLPAPLIAARHRWHSVGGVRNSLIQIVRVVSAFTIGHSITLALGASGLLWLPSHVVEVLIAVSILISAIHALRPIFPRREPAIAGFFGLIHGLAFASTLRDLGIGFLQRAADLLGFNLGIEAMQMVVVAVLLPSLLVLSRTRQYSFFRCAGAAVAGFAALGWILERALGLHTPVDVVLNQVAERAALIAVCLLSVCAVCWVVQLTARAPAAGRELPD